MHACQASPVLPVRLSCVQCQQRKTRCDKRAPCTACSKTGLECRVVNRHRLPRGKSAKNKSQRVSLDERISRLEDLLRRTASLRCASHALLTTSSNQAVNTPSKFAGNHDNSNTAVSCLEQACQQSRPHSNNNYVATEFWTALTQEVTGLREALELTSEDEDADPVNNGMLVNSAFSGALLFPKLSTPSQNSSPATSDHEKAFLLSIYVARVDSAYRVWHWPATMATIHEDGNAGQLSGDAEALQHAVYFMAVCTLTSNECLAVFQCEKEGLMVSYRIAAEESISKTNLLTTPNVTVLHAFAIYLLALRTCLNCATAWTMLSVAVRVGNALGLGCERADMFSADVLQLRRRLWYFIGLLDTHCALDRGTLPIIPYKAMGPAPTNVSDVDFTNGQFADSIGTRFTDMSFSCMIYEAMICQKMLCDISAGKEDARLEWERRKSIVDNYEASMLRKFYAVPNDATPIQKLTSLAAREIVSNMHILLRRPPYQTSGFTIPLSDDFDTLHVATQVLERSLQLKQPCFSDWAWKSWVKWYVLAVVLAELYAHPDTPSFEKSYTIARSSFEQHKLLIADGEKGMLWQPIVKLMRLVEQRRQTACETGMPTEPCVTYPAAFKPHLDEAYSTSATTTNCLDFSNFEGFPTPHIDLYAEYSQPNNDDASLWSWNLFLQDANICNDDTYWLT